MKSSKDIEELDVYKYALKLHSKGKSLEEVMEAIKVRNRYGDKMPESTFSSLQDRVNSLYIKY